LIDFEKKIQNLDGFLGRKLTDSAYQAAGIEIFPSAASAGGSPAPHVVTWPLATDPAKGQPTTVDGTLCILASGGDLTSFLAVAKNADTTTLWSAPSGSYTLAVRPLFPDEAGCSPLAG
jgi:hypothetical protein